MTNLLALPSETVLAGDYKIKRVLGAGGFGITYLAEEMALQRRVTIKEYFPSEYAARIDDVDAVPRSKNCAEDYKWGLDRFIEEAKALARFEHPNIVRVFRYFRENQTGYMVLQFEEGVSLRNWLKDLKRAPRQAELDQIVEPLLSALELLHKQSYLHRDIAPDNIIVRKDRSPVLIDFGSARGEMAHQSRTVSALVKPGYSPYEQYASTTSNQGPWTDIYALGATLYQAVTGKRPPDAPARIVKDEYVSARDAAIGAYRPGFLAAVDKALRLEPKDRPQSVLEWRGPLLAPPEKPPIAKRVSLGLGLRRRAAPEPIAEVALTPQAPHPPPPDAPQPQGQLLDYIDSLKQPPQAAPAPQPMRAAADAARLKTRLDALAQVPEAAATPAAASRHGLGYGPPPATALVPAAAPQPAAKADPPRIEAAAAPVAMPVPVPVRKRRGSLLSRALFFLRPPWRGLIFKLGVGVAVAALAVSYQQSQPPTPSRPKSADARPMQTAAPAVTPNPAQRPTAALPAVIQPRLDPRPAVTLTAHRGAVLAVAVLPGGRRIVTVGVDGQARISEADSGTLARAIPLAQSAPAAVSAASPPFAPTPPPAPPVAAALHAAPVTGVATDGAVVSRTHLVVAHADGAVFVWDLEKGERIAATRRLDGAVAAVAFTGDAERFAAAGPDGRLMLLDRRNPSAAPIAIADGHREAITAIAYVGERNYLLTASADRTIKSWNADSLSRRRTHAGHRDAVTALDVAADGRMFASGSEDGQVRLWSTLASSVRRTLRAHEARVTALAHASNGEMLASGATDGTVKLWDLRSGKEIAAFHARAGSIRALAFLPGRLVIAGDDGSTKIWDISGVRVAKSE